MDYRIVLEPLSELHGGGYLAVVPDLPGCRGDGATPGEALADVMDAIVEWEMASKSLGRAMPKARFRRARR